MSTARTRVVEEREQLAERLGKLRELLSRQRPPFISEQQWALLVRQEEAMGLYFDILGERLNAWEAST